MVVTMEELRLEMKNLPVAGDRQARALVSLLERKRMVAEAKALGLDDLPEVRRALDGVLIQRLREERLQPRLDAVAVSDAEIVARYTERPQDFTSPAAVTMAVLFLRSNPADEAGRERNRKQLKAAGEKAESLPVAAGFGALAVGNSEHQATRYRGGILPPLDPAADYGDWHDELISKATELKLGDITPIFETRDGQYLGRLVERISGRAIPLEEAAPKIRRELLGAREREVRRAFEGDLRRRYPETVDRKRLGALDASK